MFGYVLQRMSEVYHVPAEEIAAEMELSIEEGYQNRNEEWIKMFGDKKPSIEEFIATIMQQVQ